MAGYGYLSTKFKQQKGSSYKKQLKLRKIMCRITPFTGIQGTSGHLKKRKRSIIRRRVMKNNKL